MQTTEKKIASPILVIIAFATVYLVWGSTYFFIQIAIREIPPFLLGALRFLAAGLVMMIWCLVKGERIWSWQQIKPAAISGFLLLFVGNGAVIWAEKSLASSLVAVLVSAAPLWFVLLDKPRWKENLTNRKMVLGLIIGFIGVVLLFSEQTAKAFSIPGAATRVIGLVILLIGSMSWAAGSLYSKHRSSGSGIGNTTWQLLAAGLAFLPLSWLTREWTGVQWKAISGNAWLSLGYLIVMGSLAAYTAYVWLLTVRPATQVSTYAYVNPIVAVLLGVFFAGEEMSLWQFTGLVIILSSVLLINKAKSGKQQGATSPAVHNGYQNTPKPLVEVCLVDDEKEAGDWS
ncbi:MAG: EamA family transporter [Flavisolibacter sp.]